ncbi:hypothetical protein B1A99_24775 [Cohnella sp. CIP 111063]|uniref:thermonuclease family protein n=1 Tax=unclassified Cohnella TaxID=2636738 RepID=UPI000B8BCDC8|nr:MULTISPECIES: thermonuclease family protein [unclassified Cohnella]OXS54998.1 hypothetical protein B1A99_24775 [Cohnella sp. CIP 111063]PRX65133.1 nuclease-like protein [Cohnella sp. SGD-V74]
MKKWSIGVMVVFLILTGCYVVPVEPLYHEEGITSQEVYEVKGMLLESYEETLAAFKGEKSEKSSQELIEEIATKVKGDTPTIPADGTYMVLSCYDGDTCTIQNGKRREAVRLLNIDAPEIKSKDRFAAEARAYLRKQVVKKKVMIEFGLGKDRTGRDKYGRLLGYFFVNGNSINEQIVRNGLARVAYVFEPDTKYAEDYQKAEAEAEDEQIGIWSITGYVTDNGFDRSK